MAVDRCICHDVTFERLRRHVDRHAGAGLDELQRRFGCGTGCGLCIPYIRAMLRTGRTTFDPTECVHGPPASKAGPSP